VVPADDKKTARLIVSEVILDAFRGLELHYPVSSRRRQRELAGIRNQL
jgi:hypothetical protein